MYVVNLNFPAEKQQEGESNPTFMRAEDAVEDIYQKMLASCSTTNTTTGQTEYNQNVAYLSVVDNKGGVYYIDIGEYHIDMPGVRLFSNNPRSIRLESVDMEDAYRKTQEVLLRRAKISMNVVVVTVRDILNRPIFNCVINNMNAFPTTEEEAYIEILAIFFFLPSDDELWEWQQHPWQMRVRHIDHNRVLALLEKYPNLASRNIQYGEDNGYYDDVWFEDDTPAWCFDKALPLHCMLGAPNPPSLETVQAVHKLNPNAVSTMSDRDYTAALHMALMMKPSDRHEILEFVFKANPNAILHFNDDGDVPVDMLLKGIANGTAHLATLKLLLDLCPDIMGHIYFFNTYTTGNLLENAFSKNCPDEVLWFIANRLPWYFDQFSLSLHHRDRPIQKNRIKILRKVLPQLKKLTLDNHWFQWSAGALEMLLSSLVQNASVVQLKIFLRLTPIVCKLLGALLQRNKTLEKLDLVNSSEDNGMDTATMRAAESILAGLACNQGLRYIRLWGFTFPSWDQIEIAPRLDPNQNLRMNRNLQELLIITDQLDAGFVPGMLRVCPTVNDLYLRVRSGDDSRDVESLARIVAACPGLETLHFGVDHRIELDDIRPVCEALKQNNTMKSLSIRCSTCAQEAQVQLDFLEVLEESNVTLEGLTLEDKEYYNQKKTGYPKVEYYLDLNKWGRKNARCNHTSRRVLVGLLGKVVDASPDVLGVGKRHNMHYGLLRENPSLWSL